MQEEQPTTEHPTGAPAKQGAVAGPGDIVRVEIDRADAYDLIGRVVEIVRPAEPAVENAMMAAAAPVQRIATGAALRVLA